MREHTLSQHFLKNPRLALILIGHSNLKKRDTVLEIGAGSGVITSALSHRVAKVIAVEPDHITAEKLRENLKKRKIENVEIIEEALINRSEEKTIREDEVDKFTKYFVDIIQVEKLNREEIISRLQSYHSEV